MADDLKRVGLVFKEDGAVDFKKTLQEVNLELNKNYNQFKLTQAQWDSSTKSTEKLRAEQEYLKNAYEIQSDKVSTLKMQLSDLENAENKNTTAIKKKRNELTNAEVKLESYNKRIKEIEGQLNNTGKSIEEFGTKVEKSGDKIEKAGKKMSAFSIATGTALVTSAKSSIDFEDAFTGVEKTVDGTAEQMEELKQGIRNMAKEIPSTTTEISAVAEAAGQLGIKTEDILSFTKVMIDLGNSTNLSAEEAASSLAKFANVTKMSAKDYDKLGSTIVALGNNFATTEADIVSMATRLAATGELSGLSQSQILSLATAMSSVGIEAEAGGSAMSKLLKKIQLATELGGDDLKQFAKVAGMTSSEFKKAYEKDAVKALSAFISGLNDTKRNGKSAIAILNDMDLTEVRLSNTILSLANASDVMNKAVDLGNEAWEDNTALTNEANKRYDTLKSKITIAINKLKDMAITLGNKLMPSIEKVIDKVGKWIEKFENLSDEEVDMIVKLGLIVTAAGPVITIFGKLTSILGNTIKGVGTFTQAIGVAKGAITSTSTAVNNLATVFSTINPATLAITVALGGLIAASTAYTLKVQEETKEFRKLRDEVTNQKESWEELSNSRKDALSNSMSEIENSERLIEELKKITDENGKVKEGYETRAQIILTTLNKALGTEYKMNGNIISQYKDLKANIDDIIAKKKAEAALNAYQGEYETALKKQKEATENLVKLKQQLNETPDIITKAGISKQIGEQTELISNYGKVIIDYENLQKASIEGSKDAINKAVESIGISYEKSKTQIGQSIEEQIAAQANYVKILKETRQEAVDNKNEYEEQIINIQLESNKKQLDNLIESLRQQTSTVQELTPGQIEAWKYAASQSFEKYSEELSKLPPETKKKIEDATGVISMDSALINATGDKANQALKTFDANLAMKETAQKKINDTAQTLNGDTTIQEEAGNIAQRAEDAIQNNDSTKWGEDMVEGLGDGIRKKGNSNWFTNILSGLAGKIASYIHFSRPDVGPLREYEKWMPDMVEGLGKSLDKSSPSLINSVKKMSDSMANELQDINEIKGINSSVNNGNIIKIEIDYNKMANSITKSLTNCKFTLDEDGFAKIVKDELYKVV